MRGGRLLGGLVFLAALAGPARAQTVLYTAVVLPREAEVRSGNSTSPELYATNRLRQGNVVEVMQDMGDGWLAIRPPADSFSYVNTRFVKEHPDAKGVWVVYGDNVPVFMGSEVEDRKPTVRGASVQRGTQLRSKGQPRPDGDDRWLPIVPPPQEVRYIRAEVVTRLVPGTTPGALPANVAAKLSTPTAPVQPVPAVVVPMVRPVSGGSSDPRWQRAQQAEQAGRVAEAVQLYMQLGTEVLNENHDLAMQAINHAEWLRTTYRLPPGPPQPRAETGYAAGPAPQQPPSVPAQLTARTGPAGYPPPAPAAPQAPAASMPRWTDPGYLREAESRVDGLPAYRLEDSAGRPRLYVVAGTGIDLRAYVGRPVRLYGPLTWRTERGSWLMTVSYVQLLQ
jgi:hypothetical protein